MKITARRALIAVAVILWLALHVAWVLAHHLNIRYPVPMVLGAMVGGVDLIAVVLVISGVIRSFGSSVPDDDTQSTEDAIPTDTA